MTGKYVTYTLEEDIALVGLNRPDKRNAFNEDVRNDLSEATIRANEEAKVGVIFGHGDCFCAGLDLAYLKQHMARGERQRSQIRGVGGGRGFDLIARGDIPFVAALHGAVIGGGLEIAASAHIRVADRTAYFALPEGQRGIYVGGGGSVRISRLMSVARMTDLMLTGRVLSVDEADKYNLVQYVVDEGEALNKAKELAKKIATNRRESNYSVINGLPRIADLSYNDGLFVESLVVGTTFGDDAAERLDAFLQKRAKRIERSGD